MLQLTKIITACVLAVTLLNGCTGTQTFHSFARAGDTVAIAAGWQHYFTRDNITVTITPSSGAPVVYSPDDPAIRAVVNMYPDPISSLIVSERTGQNLTLNSLTLTGTLSSAITGDDRDWWQTVVFIDLPLSLPEGLTTVQIDNPESESASSQLFIVQGLGNKHRFGTTFGQLQRADLASLERLSHYVISFTGGTIPYAIEIKLAHDPDKDNGGVGRAHVINPGGALKSLFWTDDGSNTLVVVMPANGQTLTYMKDFKLYISGGINNLSITSMEAYDADGNDVPGVTATVEHRDITISNI